MQRQLNELIQQTSGVFLDKQEAVQLSCVCLLAGGHLLIEDVPGVGKTTLVQTLGQLLGLKTHRIQFTVDLMPGDILGGHIYNPKEHEFHFHPGPLFAELILADELNRASPRTQSALLQSMEEGVVSLDGKNWQLPQPFFVIATQNPNQNLGTFPLPESQLDRFMLSLELNYASKSTEIKIFQSSDRRKKIQQLQPLLNAESILKIQETVDAVHVSDIVAEYAGRLLENSRREEFPGEALSTRAGIALIKAAKAWAYLEDRDYLKPEDLQSLIKPVFAHRLGGNNGLRQGREWAEQLAEQTAVPR